MERPLEKEKRRARKEFVTITVINIKVNAERVYFF